MLNSAMANDADDNSFDMKLVRRLDDNRLHRFIGWAKFDVCIPLEIGLDRGPHH